jgi:acyl-CoA reductase-like NAD-dependent aldehyde dehydrogenase
MTTVLDQLSTDEPPAYGLLMSGRPIAGSGPTVEVRSRLDGSLLAELATAGPDDVRAAYEAAARASRSWAARTPPQRAAVLHRAASLFRERADELAGVITAEMGKPRGEALAEVEKGASVLDYYAEVGYRPLGKTFRTDADEDVFTLVEPLGVVTLVTPWNFPFTIPLRKLSAALAAGNAVLFKPSMNAALCALVIGRTLLDAGIDPDVLHVVIGQSSVIEKELLTAPELGGVSLTGSYETACAIRRILPVEIPFQAELGGKNTMLVWRDANIELAVDLIRQSAFRNNGQICTSAGRVLVHDEVYDGLLAALSRAITNVPHSSDEGELGILASDREQAKVEDAVASARGQAREVVRPDWSDRTPPTVIVDPPVGALTREEIFGPVITFERVDDLDRAIELANDTAYGLTAGIVTSDISVARQFWLGVRAGTVKVNAPMTGTPFHVPFEGHAHSGAGHSEGGLDSLDFFTRTKTIYVRGTD